MGGMAVQWLVQSFLCALPVDAWVCYGFLAQMKSVHVRFTDVY